jgi:hypothetical protein
MDQKENEPHLRSNQHLDDEPVIQEPYRKPHFFNGRVEQQNLFAVTRNLLKSDLHHYDAVLLPRVKLRRQKS